MIEALKLAVVAAAVVLAYHVGAAVGFKSGIKEGRENPMLMQAVWCTPLIDVEEQITYCSKAIRIFR